MAVYAIKSHSHLYSGHVKGWRNVSFTKESLKDALSVLSRKYYLAIGDLVFRYNNP